MHAFDQSAKFGAVVRERGIKLAGSVGDSEPGASGPGADEGIGCIHSVLPSRVAVVHARLHCRRGVEDDDGAPGLTCQPFHLRPCNRHRDKQALS